MWWNIFNVINYYAVNLAEKCRRDCLISDSLSERVLFLTLPALKDYLYWDTKCKATPFSGAKGHIKPFHLTRIPLHRRRRKLIIHIAKQSTYCSSTTWRQGSTRKVRASQLWDHQERITWIRSPFKKTSILLSSNYYGRRKILAINIQRVKPPDKWQNNQFKFGLNYKS